MGGWTPLSPWKIIEGTGRSVAVANGSSTKDATAMGAQTRACQLTLAPQTTAMAATVTITNAGNEAATATKDLVLKSTDPPLVIGCAPGDQIQVWGLGATGTLYITEMSH